MSTPINIKINGESVLDDIDNCTIAQASGDYCKTVELDFKSQTFWSECDPSACQGDLIIRVIIGDDVYEFLCEQRRTRVTDKGIGFSVWGRSKQAYLSSRYSQTIIDTDITAHPWQTGNVTISEIITYVLATYCPYTVTVNWNVTEFAGAIIYKDTFSASNSAPIDVISALAEAVGAILVPENDGSLSIESYSVAEGTSVAEYYDLDNILELDEDVDDSDRFNAVTVSGYNASSGPEGKTVNLSVEAVTTGTNYPARSHIVKVRYYHYDGLIPVVQFDAGSYGLIETSTESVTEDVELYWGKGNTTMTDVNGNTEVEGNTSIPFAIQSVTYTVNYAKYYLLSSKAGTNTAFFYFEDQSAYEAYSYEIESLLESVCSGIELDWSTGIVTLPGFSGTNMGVDVFNPANIQILEMYNSSGSNMSLYRHDVSGSRRSNSDGMEVEKVLFTDGVATLNYPFARQGTPDPLNYLIAIGMALSSWFTWLNPLCNAQVTYTVGSKTLTANSLIGNDQFLSVQAAVCYYTSHDTYIFNVPDGWSGRDLSAWFYFDGCGDAAKSIGGTFSVDNTALDGAVRFLITASGVPVPGVSCSIDGILKGETGSEGTLLVQGITVGYHDVTTSKTGWTTANNTIYISSRDFES